MLEAQAQLDKWKGQAEEAEAQQRGAAKQLEALRSEALRAEEEAPPSKSAAEEALLWYRSRAPDVEDVPLPPKLKRWRKEDSEVVEEDSEAEEELTGEVEEAVGGGGTRAGDHGKHCFQNMFF